jgi:hypothetical protein
MSDGGLSEGTLTYYGSFEISGNIDRACLKALVTAIKHILDGTTPVAACAGQHFTGTLNQSARISAKTQQHKASPKVTFTIG